MDDLDYWRLCDQLSITQAANLLIGFAPGEVEAMLSSGSELLPSSNKKYVTNLLAAQTAITNALKTEKINGKVMPFEEYDVNGNAIGYVFGSVNPDESTIDVDSLRSWLRQKGFTTGFFFPDSVDAPDYLDPTNPRYAPKLAAAINAWLAVTDPGKKSPKQALEKWLREHAAQFGLVDDEGAPVNQAIEDCSKVANWNSTGGAPKTPA